MIQLFKFFLKLGSTGFGGPIAMIGMMDSSAGREKLKQIAGDDDAPEELRKLAKKLRNAVSQTPDAL